MDVRGDLQAFDIKELNELLGKGDLFFEGNPFIGETLLTHPKLNKSKRLSMFVSPRSREELSLLKEQPEVNVESLVTDVMRRKLLRRTQRQKGILSLKDLEEVERARRAPSANWLWLTNSIMSSPTTTVKIVKIGTPFTTVGDAGRTLRTFAQLLKESKAKGTERWAKTLSWSRRAVRKPSRQSAERTRKSWAVHVSDTSAWERFIFAWSTFGQGLRVGDESRAEKNPCYSGAASGHTPLTP